MLRMRCTAVGTVTISSREVIRSMGGRRRLLTLRDGVVERVEIDGHPVAASSLPKLL